MKVRTDFVTNSSSSSFTIAYKQFPEIDTNTLKRYPFLKGFNEFIKGIATCESDCYETREAEVISTLEELQQHFLDDYDWRNSKTFEEFLANDDNDEYTTLYKKCKEKLDEGYEIMIRDVDYGDSLNEIYKSLQSDNFIILSDMEQ